MGKRDNSTYAGVRFGKLVCVRPNGVNKYNRTLWEVRCDCGRVKTVVLADLKSGNTKSCGCRRGLTSVTHGATIGGKGTRTYNVYQSMLARCYNKNSKYYDYYGGRGIGVCKRWRDSFENFREDMGEAPKGRSIDRIDNSLGYEPDNCRWATPLEQSNNTRANVYLEYAGKRQTLPQWARELGINIHTLHNRRWHGWSDREILETPVGQPRHGVIIEYNGKKQTLSQWANELNISVHTLRTRKSRGWGDSKIIETSVERLPKGE